MKIVLVDKEEKQKIGGMGVYTENLYKYLKKNGHQVSIVRFTNKRINGHHIFPIPYYMAEQRSYIFLPSEKTLSLFKNHLKKLKPDIVYTSIGLSPLDFFLPSICHDQNIPIAGIWHADFNWEKGSYQFIAKSVFLTYLPFCRQLDCIHLFSHKLSDFYQRRGLGKERILILPNGVDTSFYSPDASSFAQKNKIKRGVLFLGRLTLQKNPELLIKAFTKINPDPATKLILVGYGELEKQLRQDYQDRRIIFTGAILNENQKRDIIRACQIFVLPSRFEGLPLALLEAMSCGLACITSDAGSNVETLNNAGIVIPGKDLGSQLPFALKLLFDYPQIQKLLGKKARLKAQKQHNEKNIFGLLETKLNQIIQDYNKNGPPKFQVVPIEGIQKNISAMAKYLTSS